MKRLVLPWNERAAVIRVDAPPREKLTSDELAIVDSFHLQKRRDEWMRARLALKLLGGAAGRCVSFSHSGAYGAAAIDDLPVGIDVEVVREIRESAAHLFLSGDEHAAAQRCSIEHALLHFWSAKEAAWKQRGGSVPTLKRIALQLIDERADGLTFDLVETVRVEDVIVALTRPTS